MELVSILRQLWQRKLRLVPVILLAAFVALLSAYKLPSPSHPALVKRSVQLGAASSQILVDSPASTLVEGADSNSLGTLSTRARVYAQYLSSLEARAKIAAASGIPQAAISTHGPFSADTGRANYQPQPSAARANDVLKEGQGYRLVFDAQEAVPIITVSAQAPTAQSAVKLAEASFVALSDYVAELERQAAKVPDRPAPATSPGTSVAETGNGVVVRELGAPEGGTIGAGNGMILMIFAFIVVMGLGCVAISVAPGIARQWRQLEWAEDLMDPRGPAVAAEEPAGSVGNGGEPMAPHHGDVAQERRAASTWS
jgi:hypothetical protein